MIKIGLIIGLLASFAMAESNKVYTCKATKFGNGVPITDRQRAGMPIASLKLTINSQLANIKWSESDADFHYAEDHLSGMEVYVTAEKNAVILVTKKRDFMRLDMGADGLLVYDCKK